MPGPRIKNKQDYDFIPLNADPTRAVMWDQDSKDLTMGDLDGAKHDRAEIPMPEPAEDEGAKAQRGGGGMQSTRSLHPSQQRQAALYLSPEALHMWADAQIKATSEATDRLQYEPTAVEEAKRRSGGTPSWLDRYMEKQ